MGSAYDSYSKNQIKDKDGNWIPLEGTPDGAIKTVPIGPDGEADLTNKTILGTLSSIETLLRIIVKHHELNTSSIIKEKDVEKWT